MIGANEFTLEDRNLAVCTVFQREADYRKVINALHDQGIALESQGDRHTRATHLTRHEVQHAVRKVMA